MFSHQRIASSTRELLPDGGSMVLVVDMVYFTGVLGLSLVSKYTDESANACILNEILIDYKLN